MEKDTTLTNKEKTKADVIIVKKDVQITNQENGLKYFPKLDIQNKAC